MLLLFTTFIITAMTNSIKKEVVHVIFFFSVANPLAEVSYALMHVVVIGTSKYEEHNLHVFFLQCGLLERRY